MAYSAGSGISSNLSISKVKFKGWKENNDNIYTVSSIELSSPLDQSLFIDLSNQPVLSLNTPSPPPPILLAFVAKQSLSSAFTADTNPVPQLNYVASTTLSPYDSSVVTITSGLMVPTGPNMVVSAQLGKGDTVKSLNICAKTLEEQQPTGPQLT